MLNHIDGMYCGLMALLLAINYHRHQSVVRLKDGLCSKMLGDQCCLRTHGALDQIHAFTYIDQI